MMIDKVNKVLFYLDTIGLHHWPLSESFLQNRPNHDNSDQLTNPHILAFLNFLLISWIIPHLVQGAVQIGRDDGKMRRRAVNCRFAAFQANRRFNTAFHERMLIADQILNYKFSIKNVTLLVLQFALCRAITLPNTLPCPIMYGNLFPGAGKGCTLL